MVVGRECGIAESGPSVWTGYQGVKIVRIALRNIAAVFVAFVVASIVMMIVEIINGRVLYPELAKSAEGVRDRDTLGKLMAGAPIGALWVVITGWALGGLAGGCVTAKLQSGKSSWPGYVLGLLLMLAGVANNLMIPPPVWFWITSLFVLMPAAIVGARLGSRRPAG